MSLVSKSLIELRGIAQSLDVPDVFKKDQTQLIQAIEMKQKALMPEPKVEVPLPAYDARLMTKPPSKKTTEEEITELLQPYIARGLHVKFSDEQWFMTFGRKSDEGTLRMPMRIVLRCAERIMA